MPAGGRQSRKRGLSGVSLKRINFDIMKFLVLASAVYLTADGSIGLFAVIYSNYVSRSDPAYVDVEKRLEEQGSDDHFLYYYHGRTACLQHARRLFRRAICRPVRVSEAHRHAADPASVFHAVFKLSVYRAKAVLSRRSGRVGGQLRNW